MYILLKLLLICIKDTVPLISHLMVNMKNKNCLVAVFFVLGDRDCSGLFEERQHGALLPEASVGSDQVFFSSYDEPG